MNRIIKTMKKVVMVVGGTPVGRFDCLGDAARTFNVTASTIKNRILRGAVIDSVSFRFFESDEDNLLPNMSPHRKEASPKKNVSYKCYSDYKSDDMDLSDSRYTIVPYEVKNKRICITRCTALEAPQPFVGSAQCANCPHFQGRNKKTHQVACSSILRRSLR